MKKFNAFWMMLFLVLLNIRSLHGEIPFGEAAGLYEAAQQGQKENSPLWAMVALHSGIMANIRFFGNYGSLEQSVLFEGWPEGWIRAHLLALALPHAIEKNDVPRDGISALIQQLFRSPDGAILGQNDNKNEAAVDLVKDKGGNIDLGKMNKLLKLIIDVKGREPENNNWDQIAQKIRLILDPKYKNPVLKIPNLNNDNQRKQFLATNLAYILSMALKQEMDQKPHDKPLYPNNISLISLLAYAWMMAESRQDMAKLHVLLDPAHINATRPFDAAQYFEHKEKFLKQLFGHVILPQDIIALFRVGFNQYEDMIPTPIGMKYHTKYSKFKGDFPDCGETSLRNFFYIVFNHRGTFNLDYFDKFIARLGLTTGHEGVKSLRAYFENFPHASRAITNKAHDAWSEVVSGLLHPNCPVSYSKPASCPVCEIDAGLSNMLSVIATMIPDPALAKAWPAQPEQKLQQTVIKLNRLVEIVSRHDFKLDWSVNGQKSIPQDTGIAIEFSINNKKSFEWAFDEGHFQIFKERASGWPGQVSWLNPHLKQAFLQAWFLKPADLSKNPLLTPALIFGQNIASATAAIKLADLILSQNYKAFYPLLFRWLNDFTNDPRSLNNLKAMFYGHKESIGFLPADFRAKVTEINMKDYLSVHNIADKIYTNKYMDSAVASLNNKHLLDEIIQRARENNDVDFVEFLYRKEVAIALAKLKTEAHEIAREYAKGAKREAHNYANQAIDILQARAAIAELIDGGVNNLNKIKEAYEDLMSFSPSWGFWGEADAKPFMNKVTDFILLLNINSSKHDDLISPLIKAVRIFEVSSESVAQLRKKVKAVYDRTQALRYKARLTEGNDEQIRELVERKKSFAAKARQSIENIFRQVIGDGHFTTVQQVRDAARKFAKQAFPKMKDFRVRIKKIFPE